MDGNENAFSQLYTLHYENLCKYIYGHTKNLQKSEDIVQSTMLIAWEKRETLNPEKSVKSYLYKIAFHQFINIYRNEEKHSEFLIAYKDTALSYFPSEKKETLSEKENIIFNAIETLPPKCKEVFLLSKQQSFKYKEIAEELDISIKTVEIHMSKALRKLKEALSYSNDPLVLFFLQQLSE